MMLLLTSVGAMAEVEFHVVTTAADFAAHAKANDNIRLGADINIKNIGTIDVTYTGIIDGENVKDGQTVYYSLHGDSGDGRVNKPIFKKIEGATLKNLLIRNFRIDWNDDDIGAVAYTAKNCSFNNVIVSEVSIFNDDDEAGAIVGKAESCDFRNVRGMGNDVTVDGTHAGGFVGISYNSVYCNCSNSAYSTVYADGSWGNAYAGGFVGESKSDQFVFCVNFASVGALDDRIGGVTGYATQSFFTNCTNSGLIIHCEEDNFISYTSQLKKGIENKMKELETELKGQYDKQDFDLTAGFVSFIGTIGLSVATFGVELCLLTFASAGVGAFALTVIVVATGITVTLINLIDAEIGAHDEMGGICGTCEGSTFDACSNFGRLMCRDSYVGGIVGLMRKQLPCRISNCLNAGVIQGFDLVGGIFGENEPPHEVTHCLNVGEIHAQSSGKWDPIGNVEGNSSFYLSKNYYKAMAYNPDAGGRIPVTAKEISDGSVAGWLNDGATGVNALWHQTIGTDEYPVPDPSHEAVNPQKHDDVFVISSVEDLKALRKSVNSGTKSHYVVYISEDIDCSGITWEPIGTSTNPFSGSCYGNGHTISNLNTANDKTKNGVGFFGVVDINTEVRDLFIGSGKIVGGNGVGAIIGYCDHKAETEGYVKIVGCGNAATIEGNYDCGGIVGAIYSDPNLQLILDNCYNMGEIIANEKSAALCGFAKEKVLVTSCWNSGKVTGYESNMGFARADASATFEIHNCYNAESLPGLLQKGVSSFTPADAKDGTLCYNLNGKSNDASVGLPWEQDITSEAEYPTYRGDGNGRCVYTSRNITSTYGTVVLPYTVKSNDNIRYYVLDSSEENTDETKVCFKAVDELPAGTPAIFRVKTTGTYDFISSDYVYAYTLNETTKGDWTMTGNLTHESKEFTGTDLNTLYYISGGQLKQATKTLTISPFRAYLNGPVRGATTRALNIAFDDETEATGLRLVPVDTQNGTTTYGIFNLSGQRIDAPQSGINIVRSNNKKTVKFINK